MQVCNATVRLSGDVRFQVPKEGITPAEILVLQHVQAAEDAVSDIVVTGAVTRNMHQEFDRLCEIYGDKKVRNIFPGAHPRLPLTFDEISITPKADMTPPPVEDPKPAPRPRGRPRIQASPPSAEPVAAAERQDAAEPVAAAEREEVADHEELGGDDPE